MSEPEDMAHVPEGWGSATPPPALARAPSQRNSILRWWPVLPIAFGLWFFGNIAFGWLNRPKSDLQLARDAYPAARERLFVRLKAPATAKFIKTEPRYARDTHGKLWVYVVCDAQNDYGALTRDHVWVRVSEYAGKWSGDLISEAGKPDRPRFAPVEILYAIGFPMRGQYIDEWHYSVRLENSGDDIANRDLKIKFLDDGGSVLATTYHTGVAVPPAKTVTIQGKDILVPRDKKFAKVEAEFAD